MPPLDLDKIASALGARRSGRGWIARCPAHDDGRPSLSIGIGGNGKLLAYCFAGCSHGDIVSALQKLNLDPTMLPELPLAQSRDANDDTKRRTAHALKLWCEAVPAAGTIVERYLNARGIQPSTSLTRLKFHVRLKHPSGGVWPAMIALVSQGKHDRPSGIHRTYLTIDGKAKAPVEPAKMMLGICRGGAVRLAPYRAATPLMIGEGIETVASAMQATGFPGWAALSTSGMVSLDLPPTATNLIILADGDNAGQRSSLAAAKRWQLEGRRIRIASAPNGFDFNDCLRAGISAGSGIDV